ncbi:acyl transferase [Arcticibacter tournemirensis]|uniref:Acyl transferase n=1 Tax=Arcticibacter tournemirensis TaxID=699437 RepID=A0A4Q0MDK3_9SPHI|nr:acyl transferase [Arcticibacter tournemirensis]RXF71193.1 acyl transferase [Arcticibacter tournemirensis]
MKSDFSKPLFSIQSDSDFNQLAIETFQFQAAKNQVYSRFVEALRIDRDKVNEVSRIPFLPVEFFKSHAVKSGEYEPQIIFSSSGTTGMIQSRHLVKEIGLYEESFLNGFNFFYGDISQYTILALLPSYLEREGSSLIYMVDELIKRSGQALSGYFLHNHQDLYTTLQKLQAEKQKVILIGVTYALLDFIEKYEIHFPDLIVMETGGMKGKRKEIIRSELHEMLCGGFGIASVHSEYGMTELLSQAYSKGDGVFQCPPWMKVLSRDVNDPLSYLEYGRTGGINIIDLANRYSCSFISTQDLGKVHPDGSFEIAGRFDNSDIRGCNLLVQ